ncbi:MAG: hypothetical protein R2813_10120 [Flavobacteriales bacterium]
MKTTFQYLLLVSCIAAFGLQSCNTEGCTDGDATNFNADADTDDGSCKFEGELVFWYTEKTSDFLVGDDAITLTYYFDGELVGSGAANVFWTGAPECGQNGSVTVSKDLGGDKSKSYSYKVEDQTGHQYYSGNATVEANTCVTFELE